MVARLKKHNFFYFTYIYKYRHFEAIYLVTPIKQFKATFKSYWASAE